MHLNQIDIRGHLGTHFHVHLERERENDGAVWTALSHRKVLVILDKTTSDDLLDSP